MFPEKKGERGPRTKTAVFFSLTLALALTLFPPPGVNDDGDRPIIDKVNFHVSTENAATHRFG